MISFSDTDIPTKSEVAECPDGFEAIGKAYTYGYKEGCLCDTSDKKKKK